jgi:aldehyde dehydrogenase (NAD+)
MQRLTRGAKHVQWLTALGISPSNPAACMGPEWLEGSQYFESDNPATGEPIARVGLCSSEQYESVIAHAVSCAAHWRDVPAPQRGEVVRRAASELRRNKDMLGRLIALETGKIKSEGDA